MPEPCKLYKSGEISIGTVRIGGNHPILVQSMCNTPTQDIRSTVEQCIRIIQAGGGMVRLAVRNVREARNLSAIRLELRKRGYRVPVSADVHFNPRIAIEAARHVEKVRINPGNFANGDIETPLMELIKECRTCGTALRVGVNHGSLSERIMEQYGDTPEGMTESAMEYLMICRREEFRDVAVSLKSSNTRVMIQANRMMARKMSEAGMAYPVHLGITEAGEGEEGRIRSAVGIGTLLNEGIGDTIRVSLTEPPENEIPVAIKILDSIMARREDTDSRDTPGPEFYLRRESDSLLDIGGGQLPVVIGGISKSRSPDFQEPDYVFAGENKINQELPAATRIIQPAGEWRKRGFEKKRFFPIFTAGDFLTARIASPLMNFIEIEARQTRSFLKKLHRPGYPACLVYRYESNKESRAALFHLFSFVGLAMPVIIRALFREKDPERYAIRAASELGRFYTDGQADGLWLEDPDVAFRFLQASRARMTRTEFIACPSCARTQFDIQERLKEVIKATSHLRKLKIAVMGCIVNGPGEMADADYGYVGAGPGKISLYRGKECVKKNVPEARAIDEMILMIKESGDWEEPKDMEK